MEWIDVFRFVVFLLCAANFVLMIRGFARHRKVWNSKTRDYWYGRIMWSVVGMSSAIEGTLRNTPFRYTMVFIGAAALVTVKGALQKGPWGTPDERDNS